jgi:hypothetical protein
MFWPKMGIAIIMYWIRFCCEEMFRRKRSADWMLSVNSLQPGEKGGKGEGNRGVERENKEMKGLFLGYFLVIFGKIYGKFGWKL